MGFVGCMLWRTGELIVIIFNVYGFISFNCSSVICLLDVSVIMRLIVAINRECECLMVTVTRALVMRV